MIWPCYWVWSVLFGCMARELWSAALLTLIMAGCMAALCWFLRPRPISGGSLKCRGCKQLIWSGMEPAGSVMPLRCPECGKELNKPRALRPVTKSRQWVKATAAALLGGSTATLAWWTCSSNYWFDLLNLSVKWMDSTTAITAIERGNGWGLWAVNHAIRANAPGGLVEADVIAAISRSSALTDDDVLSVRHWRFGTDLEALRLAAEQAGKAPGAVMPPWQALAEIQLKRTSDSEEALRAAHLLPMEGLPLASAKDATAMNRALAQSSCVLWHDENQADLFLRLDLSGVDDVPARVHGRYRVRVLCGEEVVAEGHVAIQPHQLTWLNEEVIVLACELRQLANQADIRQGIRVRLTPGEDTFGNSAHDLQELAQRMWPIRLQMEPATHDVRVAGVVLNGLPLEAYAEAPAQTSSASSTKSQK